MAGLPSSVVQRAAVVARQLKARLGAQQQPQQQGQQQQHQQSGRQVNQQAPAAEQHQQQDVGQAAALPVLVAQVYQALKLVQQGDSQLSDYELSKLQQLQGSAARVLAAESEHGC
jgi:DNA mismatch repair ATPase MutS